MSHQNAPALPGQFKRLLFLTAFLLSLAARAETQFDVFLGFEGCTREMAWFPIVCEIRNDSAPFTGVVEIQPVFQGAGDVRKLKVELPTGTTKRVTVPVFSRDRSGSGWNVRLLDEVGKVKAARLDIRVNAQASAGSVLLGSISRTPGGAPEPRRPVSSWQLKIAAAELPTSIFPDNPLALQGLTSLYLHSQRAGELKPAQVTALVAWVRGGGRLVVALENALDLTAAPWLGQLIPCSVSGQAMVDSHPEFQAWMVSGDWPDYAPAGGPSGVYQPRRTESPFPELRADPTFEKTALAITTTDVIRGHVWLKSSGLPLAISGREGKGEIVVLLFSPEREPMRSWTHRDVFWSRLMQVPSAAYLENKPHYGMNWSSDSIFGAMIETSQIRKMPLGWLILLLIVYLAVIGPLDRLLISRLGRPMLTWLTFPGYVVLFSGLIYLIGYKLRSGEREYSELQVVDALPAGNAHEYHGQTYASLYSPANRVYELAATNTVAALRNEAQPGWGSSSSRETTEVLQLGDGFQAKVRVPVWSSRLLVSDWRSSGTPPVAATVVREANGWKLQVENQCERHLRSLRFAAGGRIYELGELAPKQKILTNITTAAGMVLEHFVGANGTHFQQAAQFRNRSFAGHSISTAIQDPATASMACSFLTQFPGHVNEYQQFVSVPGLDLTQIANINSTAVLLAWDQGFGVMPKMSRFEASRGTRNTLWRQIIYVSGSLIAPGPNASLSSGR